MDADRIVNIRQRVSNLTPDSPFASWKSALDSMIDAVRSASLETGIAESDTDRDARRVRINELQQQLLNELIDPEQEYIWWWAEEQEPKYGGDGVE